MNLTSVVSTAVAAATALFTLVLLLIVTWAPNWMTDVDSDTNYFTRLQDSQSMLSYSLTGSSALRSMGLYIVDPSRGEELLPLPLRDYPLVISGQSLHLSVFSALVLIFILSFQAIDYGNVKAMSLLAVWAAACHTFFAFFGTTLASIYCWEYFNFDRYGWAHNLAWVTDVLTLVPLGIVAFRLYLALVNGRALAMRSDGNRGMREVEQSLNRHPITEKSFQGYYS